VPVEKSLDQTSNVTVSIVTWNHAHCIAACLQSVLRQTVRPAAIVVYDNASTDGTVAVLEKFKGRVPVICSPENRGFCGGHNAVISQTAGEFVLLVNPDITLREDYIENALKPMGADENTGTVCGLLLQNGFGGPDCLIDGAGLTVAKSRRFLLRWHGHPLSSARLAEGEVFGCDGALPFYRRAMIQSVSLHGQFFDEMFFAHKEDHDVSWRAQLRGWKTVFDPRCVAVHPRVFRPGSLALRKQLPPEIKYHAVKNDLLMLLKNEDGANFLKDFFRIFPRQLGIFFYALLFERHSLKAYGFAARHWRLILEARRQTARQRKIPPAEVRRRFSMGAG
jgi:GT2 family glycosyltransferase